MEHRNYVYDTERRYSAAFRDGMVDATVKDLYRRFLTAKRELERSTEQLDDCERRVRMGLGGGAEREQARRTCNGCETELGYLARRIATGILQLRRTRCA